MTASAPSLCLITPYPPGRAELGGGGWVDRRILRALTGAGAEVDLVSVTGPSGPWEERGFTGHSAGDLPLEIRDDRRLLARTARAMLTSTQPYLACKFTCMPGWQKAVAMTRERAAGRSVVTSGWPALLLAAAAGVAVDVHLAHNVDALIAAEHAPRPLRALGEVRRLRRAERRLLQHPGSVLALSRVDAARLTDSGVAASVLPLPLQAAPTKPRALSRSVGFIGKATWPPNARALDVLLGPVHDHLLQAGVEVGFVLAGAGTDAFASHPRVARSGWVQDEADFYADIGLAVVPRLGASTGVSIKMLEAAEHGVAAVVPLSLAAAVDPSGPWIVAEDAAAIAAAIGAWWHGDEPPQPAEWVAAHPAEATAASILARLG